MAALITTPRLIAVGGGALAELPGLMARLGLGGYRFSISWLAAPESTMTFTIGASTMRSAIDGPGTLLSPEEVRAYQPEPPTTGPGFAMIRARRRMVETGQWNGAQSMGRRWPIGCVALEVTQRCNLDCTLCYLSETAEAVKDLPLEELFRRIDTIFEMYGPNTDIQVTGGDPTLRPREELVAVTRRIRERGECARHCSQTAFAQPVRCSKSLPRPGWSTSRSTST